MRIGRKPKFQYSYCNPKKYIKLCKSKKKGYHKRLVSIDGYAKFLNVNRSSLYEWAKNYPDFADTLARIKDQQYMQLIDDGLYDPNSNPNIIRLVLQTNHKLKERKDLTSGDKPTPLLEVNKIPVIKQPVVTSDPIQKAETKPQVEWPLPEVTELPAPPPPIYQPPVIPQSACGNKARYRIGM